MKRCELCGNICWRGRTVVTVSDGMKPIKIAINGKECTEVKLCKKCANALLKIVIDVEEEE